MELPEPIETLNSRLKDIFGIDTVSGLGMFRIVFADEQFEKRTTECTDSGIFLLVPEVRLLPKYQWLKGLYLIETLVAIPDVNVGDLPTQKTSYEPLFVFWDKDGGYLPPKWEVADMAINIMLAARGKQNLHKYVDKEGTTEDAIAERKRRIDGMIEYFGGDESGLMGSSIDSGNSSFVPHNYEKGE